LKKQINPTIKAHLIRSAFYLLLLIAVCAIPFALAQRRSAIKRSIPKPTFQNPDSAAYVPEASRPVNQLPTVLGSGKEPAPLRMLPLPAAPAVVLYDQINNPALPGGTTSQDFEPGFDQFDTFTADDFVVPAGQSWTITEVDVSGEYSTGGGPAASFHVFFYQDNLTLPGTLVATRLANPYSNGANAMITLTSSVTLGPGTYWVAVQARQDFAETGQWFWENRTVVSNSAAAWQNPGGLFGQGCITYARKTTCIPGQDGDDQLFRLIGNIGSPSLPCTPQYIIDQINGTIVPGTTDIGNHGDDQVTTIALPFSYTIYDQSFNSINVSSNGNAQFTTTDADVINVCPLPWTSHNYTIFPYWDDLRTDAQSGCAAFPNGACGVFTSTSGSPPNRIFNIEWRTVYFANPSNRANYELRLYEGRNRFDVVWGTVTNGNTSATGGVQKDDSVLVQYFCNGSGGAVTGGQSYILQVTRCTPTPRPRPTPAPRP
jgi:hypothetical protein